MKPAVVIVGHGSRQATANAEFEALVRGYRERRPELDVRAGYIELAQPTLADALAEAARASRRVCVIPLFLFSAGHVKNELPLALAAARERFPAVSFQVSRAIGVDSRMLELAFERAAPILDGEPPEQTAAIVIGRGSSDADANGDFCKLVRLFGEGRGLRWALPSFIGVTEPSFEQALELVVRARPRRLVIVPYFLFAGRLIERIHEQSARFAERYTWVKIAVGAHLGVHERLFEVVDARIDDALSGAAPLPCDTCAYRKTIGRKPADVGGLNALLYSVRHSLTHAQASQHVHTHPALKRHVLVCGNTDCADRGSIELLAALRRALKEHDGELKVKITRTACMGRCGEGPTVAVYPDGIWYRNVRVADARELVSEHLAEGRLVPRLVDQIMM